MEFWKKLKCFFKYEYTYYNDHRTTEAYKTRKRFVKNWWFWGTAIIVPLLLSPNLVGIGIAACLLLTLASLAFLDEWEQFQKDKNNCDE